MPAFTNDSRPLAKHKKEWISPLLFVLVPVVGVEPTWCCHRTILSRVRLPFRHTGGIIPRMQSAAIITLQSQFYLQSLCKQNANGYIALLATCLLRACSNIAFSLAVYLKTI